MLKVELESGVRLHSVLMKRIRCKTSKSQSLFQQDSERHIDQTRAQWFDGDVILGISR